jgi:hypothetical protein
MHLVMKDCTLVGELHHDVNRHMVIALWHFSQRVLDNQS